MYSLDVVNVVTMLLIRTEMVFVRWRSSTDRGLVNIRQMSVSSLLG